METSWELWASRWRAQSEDLTARGMFRTLGSAPQSRFSHNDYLGLRHDPRLLKGLVQALEEGIPTTSTGSRLLSGNLDQFQSFESRFARAAGFPSGLVFASASEANRAIIQALVDRHDVALQDSLAHASLIDGVVQSGAQRRKFAHNDPEDLREQLRQGGGKIRLVVTESVFSMDGDIAPLRDLHQVCKEEGAFLLVDEAHAVGLFGEHRTGVAESIPKDSTLIATTQGFGKGLASAGGILCTAPQVLERIANHSRAFIFTTAPSPLAIKAAELAWDLSCADGGRHAHLEHLCTHFAQGIHALGWPLPERSLPTPIFPLLCGGLVASVQASAQLAKHNIHLRPIRPPTVPPGTERLRATVTADLHTSDLDEFLGALRHV
ncbi:MAG TPA: aminotransferase class I/II-fold pyridoxal phosphate-dependent enzyme [Fibrobacteria bacterium]|nr:aminotransferase class I/II-fold pyridoxal phosphate-dependent enzyme [Fibrobacteria bacterium]